MVNLDELVVGKIMLKKGRRELIIKNQNLNVMTLRRNSGKIEIVLYYYGKGKGRSGVSDYSRVTIIETLTRDSRDYDLAVADAKLKEAGI